MFWHFLAREQLTTVRDYLSGLKFFLRNIYREKKLIQSHTLQTNFCIYILLIFAKVIDLNTKKNLIAVKEKRNISDSIIKILM